MIEAELIFDTIKQHYFHVLLESNVKILSFSAQIVTHYIQTLNGLV